MSRKMKTALILCAVLMLLPLASACGKKPAQTPQQTTSAAISEEVATSSSSLPEMDWDMEPYRIIGRDGGSTTQFTNFEIYREEYNGEDRVDGAIWNRNAILAEKYGIDVQQTLVTNVSNTMQTLYGANENAYDLVIYQPQYVQAHASMGYLKDLLALDYIDMEQGCWNEYTNAQLTFGGKLFYTSSNFLLQDKNRTYILIYNRELAATQELGYLEDLVDNNTWTLETANQICTGFSLELDGLEGHSALDGYGVTMESYPSFSAFLFGAGFRLSEIGSDGYPKLVGAGDNIVKIIDEVMKLTENKDVCYFQKEHPENADPTKLFTEQRALMFSTFLSVFDTGFANRDDFAYGFMPFPKADSEQKNYYTIPNINNGSLFAVPRMTDSEKAGFFLQAISEESTATTLEAFYEIKCKIRNSYDQRCSDMLDLIFANVIYDIAAIGDYGGLNNVVQYSLPQDGNNQYSTLYQMFSGVAEGEIEQIKTKYQKLD